MKPRGVFGVARSIWDHPLFKGAKFTDREAWLWLLSMARYKAGHYATYVGDIHLDRGELCHSEAFMTEAWGWHKSHVHRFLCRLEKEDMLDRTAQTKAGMSNRGGNRTAFQVLKIRNYNDYQLAALPKRTDLADAKTEPSEPTEPTGEPTGEPTASVIFVRKPSTTGVSIQASEPTSEPGIEPNNKKDSNKVLKGALPSDPPSAVQEANQWLWGEGLATLQSLVPGCHHDKARALIGRCLSKVRGGLGAKPEAVVRAIRAASSVGTADPIPYIMATIRNELNGSVQRDGDAWLVPHGSPEYVAHRERALIENSPELYQWPDTPGHVARSKDRWPPRGNQQARVG